MKSFQQYLTERQQTFDDLFSEIESLYDTYQIHNTILKKTNRTFTIWLYADTAQKLVPQIENLVKTQYDTVVDVNSSEFNSQPSMHNTALQDDMHGVIRLVLMPNAVPKKGEQAYRLPERDRHFRQTFHTARLRESRNFARAVAAVNANEPQLTGQGLTARTHRDPTNVTKDEKRALRRAVQDNKLSPTVAAVVFKVPLETILYVLRDEE